MRTSFLQLVIAAVVLGSAIVPARAEPSAVGLWEQVDENSGRAESWFRIIEHDGVYEGTIVKMFFKPGEDQDFRCEKCEGAERGAPVLGMKLIKGMHRHGTTYEDGTITDPRDGSVYHALMRVSVDGQKLEVRGYLGISLFGRSQVWNRLPDSALQQTPPAPRSGGKAQPARR